MDTDPNTFAALHRRRRRAAGLRADVGEISSVERYARVLEPLGVVDELRVILSDGDETWGTGILYRSDRAFEPKEIALVEQCVPTLARAVRHAMLRSAADHPAVDMPPGCLVLDGQDHVVLTSPAAEDLLAALEDQHVHTALVALAAETRIRGAGRATVTGRKGMVAFHAAPAKGLDGGVSVVVEHPRPAQLAPLILRAYGLSGREREIAEAVLQGLSRKAIARRCRIAEDTVDDHLQQIYRKVGVPGRAALSAVIFERFYQPHRHHAEPGPYGWFALPDAAGSGGDQPSADRTTTGVST